MVPLMLDIPKVLKTELGAMQMPAAIRRMNPLNHSLLSPLAAL